MGDSANTAADSSQQKGIIGVIKKKPAVALIIIIILIVLVIILGIMMLTKKSQFSNNVSSLSPNWQLGWQDAGYGGPMDRSLQAGESRVYSDSGTGRDSGMIRPMPNRTPCNKSQANTLKAQEEAESLNSLQALRTSPSGTPISESTLMKAMKGY